MKKHISILVFLFTIATSAQAQIQLMQLDITEKLPSSDITGLSEEAAKTLPLSTKQIPAAELQAKQIYHLSDVTKVEASTTDSYNATGYWDMLSIRGYTLDNRTNYLREGLPITAETFIALDNKEKVEILKGLGGMQAGASSPGGLVNYVVKRPTGKASQAITTGVSDSGNALIAADFESSLSLAQNIDYRINLAQEKLDPQLKDSKGERSLAAMAMDWRLPSSSLLEVEAEWSRHSQPSQAGFSLLGNKIPSVPDVNLNLNNQSWTQPVVFQGLTGTLKFTQALENDWSWSVIAGAQSLGTDDRLAYPFGCSAENNYDRYCSDGTYDMYDYRSENESRETQALKASVQGQFATADIAHQISFGVVGSHMKERYQNQAYNYAGVGNVNGTGVGIANPAQNDQATNRDSGTAEVFVTDSAKYENWQAWLGARVSYIDRSSVRTDGSRSIHYTQTFPLPWVAISYDFKSFIAYTSYGEGLESFVTPNKPAYSHPGEYLSDVRSRQYEVGVKGGELMQWSLAAFQITRPIVEDKEPNYEIDGDDEHRGLEASTSLNLSRWQVDVSAMALQATRKNSVLNTAANAHTPVNIPENAVRVNVVYQVPDVSGLSLNARVMHEGKRAIVADNTLMLPAWTRGDVGFSYVSKWFGKKTTLSFAVENVTDNSYWRESPTQYGHIYLYPGESRSLSLWLNAIL
ncbi:TonB-dependent siderophore receptor [Bdellovibrio sp. NC01]|uniref:TonB-dependent siderophore receptor n=1 Tax=Bdellovibrio sp. NC01 TaxID=2220073 RepID=UPI001156FB67|nr:TonB-dependent siderophore receptor [Bdellovibrio sp. NC01]QDK39704.1 TonB-dependent siderophore receptor [Bdellovibrio sp. NC01]